MFLMQDNVGYVNTTRVVVAEFLAQLEEPCLDLVLDVFAQLTLIAHQMRIVNTLISR